MNRIEFSDSITFEDNLVNGAIRFFDQIMIAYNMVGNYNSIKLDAHSSDPRLFILNVSCDSLDDANMIRSIIATECSQVELYGRKFILTTNIINENCISISFQKCG